MRESNIYDIAIVGAGPAGSFAAWRLSQAGYKVVVLEAGKSVKRKICGEYLSPMGVDLLHKSGVAERILADFPIIEGMDMISPAGRKVVSLFPKRQGVVCHGRAVNRQILDSRLMELAKESGAEVRTGFLVKEILRKGVGWILTAQSTEKIEARLLIGADGRKSVVSRYFGVDKKVKEKRVAIHTYIDNSRTNSSRGEMHLFSDGSYIGLDPTGEYEMNFSLVCDPEIILKKGGSLHAFNHYIDLSSDLKSRFGNLPEATKFLTASPISHKVKSIVGHNWTLIGDAAGFIDPLTGEGMYNALWMAETLSKSLIEKRNLFEFNEALQSYSVKKSQHFRQKSALNTGFQFVIRHPRLVERIARFLLRKSGRSDTFVGIIGNIYTPLQGFVKILK